MTKDEALLMAIEALDTLMMEKGSIYQKAIQACKEALEQPAQEPVAHIKQGMYGYPKLVFNGKFEYESIAAKWDDIALYTHPAPSWQGLSDDEILNIAEQSGFEWHETRHGHKYLIAPAEAEMGDGYFAIETELNNMARAIEQELKEKNKVTEQ